MKIEKCKSIKNKYHCDGIDLGDLNQIQPHGVWLELDSKSYIVTYSENATAFLETPLDDLLNHDISYFLKSERAESNFALWLTTPFSQYQSAVWSAPQKQIPILIFIHQEQGIISLEIERNIEQDIQHSTSSYFNEFVMAAMKKTLQCKTINELAKISCEEIQKLTAYDRVIIYKFDSVDFTGIVIGEVFDEKMPSYIGLRFPSTDIPASVRQMYIKLPLRYIPSILEKSVKIVSRDNQQTHQVANLTSSNLRMVAPVHVEYMHNMGICSASSVAIMQEDKLWGIISCHHLKPKYLSQSHRYILDIFANIIAAQVLAIESIHSFHEEQQIGTMHTELTKLFRYRKSLYDALAEHNIELMELVSSTGMSVYLQNVLINYGGTPGEKEVMDLISWLNKKDLPIYYTDSLPLEYEAAFGFKYKACGLFVIKVTPLENDYLLFYKPELVNTIAWAGDPTQAIKIEEKAYSPRDSFGRYLEKIENHSSPWSYHDIKSAALIHSLVATKQLQDLLQKQAMFDPMTQLLNRLYLEQTLSQEIKRALRGVYPLVVMVMDLDYFKKINDGFGHPAGDVMIQSFAQLIKAEFRLYDYKYRYGGEEFLLILPNTTLEAARKKANQLLLKTKEMQVQFNGNTLPTITVSIGISCFPENGDNAGALISAADAALYQAKAQGRDRISLA